MWYPRSGPAEKAQCCLRLAGWHCRMVSTSWAPREPGRRVLVCVDGVSLLFLRSSRPAKPSRARRFPGVRHGCHRPDSTTHTPAGSPHSPELAPLAHLSGEGIGVRGEATLKHLPNRRYCPSQQQETAASVQGPLSAATAALVPAP